MSRFIQEYIAYFDTKSKCFKDTLNIFRRQAQYGDVECLVEPHKAQSRPNKIYKILANLNLYLIIIEIIVNVIYYRNDFTNLAFNLLMFLGILNILLFGSLLRSKQIEVLELLDWCTKQRKLEAYLKRCFKINLSDSNVGWLCWRILFAEAQMSTILMPLSLAVGSVFGSIWFRRFILPFPIICFLKSSFNCWIYVVYLARHIMVFFHGVARMNCLLMTFIVALIHLIRRMDLIGQMIKTIGEGLDRTESNAVLSKSLYKEVVDLQVDTVR